MGNGRIRQLHDAFMVHTDKLLTIGRLYDPGFRDGGIRSGDYRFKTDSPFPAKILENIPMGIVSDPPDKQGFPTEGCDIRRHICCTPELVFLPFDMDELRRGFWIETIHPTVGKFIEHNIPDDHDFFLWHSFCIRDCIYLVLKCFIRYLADRVVYEHMAFLYPRGIKGGDGNSYIGHGSQFPSILTEESDGLDAHLLCLFYRLDAVFRIAAGGEDEEDVPGISESFQLTGEYQIERIIVSDRRDGGGIDREGDGRETPTFPLVLPDEFCCDMLSIGGASAIPADKELVSFLEGSDNEFRCIGDVSDIRRK